MALDLCMRVTQDIYFIFHATFLQIMFYAHRERQILICFRNYIFVVFCYYRLFEKIKSAGDVRLLVYVNGTISQL